MLLLCAQKVSCKIGEGAKGVFFQSGIDHIDIPVFVGLFREKGIPHSVEAFACFCGKEFFLPSFFFQKILRQGAVFPQGIFFFDQTGKGVFFREGRCFFGIENAVRELGKQSEHSFSDDGKRCGFGLGAFSVVGEIKPFFAQESGVVKIEKFIGDTVFSACKGEAQFSKDLFFSVGKNSALLRALGERSCTKARDKDVFCVFRTGEIDSADLYAVLSRGQFSGKIFGKGKV